MRLPEIPSGAMMISSPRQLSINIPLCSAARPASLALAAINSPSRRLRSTRSERPRSSFRPPDKTAEFALIPKPFRNRAPPKSNSSRSAMLSPSSMPTGPSIKAQPGSSRRARRRTRMPNCSDNAPMVRPAGRFPRTAPSISPAARRRTRSFQGS